MVETKKNRFRTNLDQLRDNCEIKKHSIEKKNIRTKNLKKNNNYRGWVYQLVTMGIKNKIESYTHIHHYKLPTYKVKAAINRATI